MNRVGLFIALAISVAVGIVFGFFPDFDLAISRRFFNPATQQFWPVNSFVDLVRDAMMWTVALVAAPAFIAVAWKLLFPQRPMLIPARAALFLIVTLALAPGFTANTVLKSFSGRPRPVAVTQFGGTEKFVPWWDMRGRCRDNCSFIAGEPSGAFWTISAAALAPPPWRALAYGAAISFGIVVGIMRMAYGGHFFSDVAFAGTATFLIIWMAFALIYRWRRTRLSDAALERALERMAKPVHDFVNRLLQGKRSL